jgi:hypothetical protein
MYLSDELDTYNKFRNNTSSFKITINITKKNLIQKLSKWLNFQSSSRCKLNGNKIGNKQ